MKKYFLIQVGIVLMILISNAGITAQQLSPGVISTCGGFYSNTAGMLSFTAGEMSAIETYTTSNAILTQGFQQVWELGTATSENHEDPFSCVLYPNPSTGQFNLELNTARQGVVSIQIIDLLGREIYQMKIGQTGIHQVIPLDLTHVMPGAYLVSIFIKDPYSFREARQVIQKIQIIR